MKIVAIHQPNFFPWLGYFHKIANCDYFVFLDDVQLPKKGGTWSNRVKVLINEQGKWMTAPIVRNYSGVRPINEVCFDEEKPWRKSVIGTVQSVYKTAPYYEEIFPFLRELIEHQEANIADYNIHAISKISEKIGIDVQKFQRSSDTPYKGAANEMLVSITKYWGGDVYLCGGGADGYQDEAVFKSGGVELHYQNFQHPQYSQNFNGDVFVSGLSIIDALMNLGWSEVSRLIQNRKGD